MTSPANGALPTFLIIGAQKAGTTALYYYLRHHPEIYMSRVKEPQFFAFMDGQAPALGPGDAATTTISSWDEYSALFAGKRNERAAGEASTIYLYDPNVPARIHEYLPRARLIGVLRDPAERAYSNFQHLRRDGREPLETFADALAAEEHRRACGWSANWLYVDKGFYSVQVARYQALFDPAQLLWVRYEDFDRDPQAVVRRVYAFLGVDAEFQQDLTLRLNVAGVPQKRGFRAFLSKQERLKWLADPILPASLKRRLLSFQNTNLIREGIPSDARRYLIDIYRDDIRRVEAMTGLDCSSWLEP